MELNLIRDLLGKAKGVDGYVVMDLNGAVLSQDLGAYANKIKRTEFATWILNCFYAIDGYYPQAFCLLLQYASGHLYLTRTDNRLITVMCRHGADVFSIESEFSKYRHVMAKSNTSGVVQDKTKKGETVFLKISETGAGATASPIPQKIGVPSIGLIIAVAVLVCGVIGIAAFTMTGKQQSAEISGATSSLTADTPPTSSAGEPSPQSNAPVAATYTQSTAAIARDRSIALSKIAQLQNADDQDPMNMARAMANNQNAQVQFNQNNFKAAAELWRQATTPTQ